MWAVSYFLYECENNYTYSVSCDRTDKNKVSFKTAKGLLLFMYSHNNNETMYFSKNNQINRVRSAGSVSVSSLLLFCFVQMYYVECFTNLKSDLTVFDCL